MACISTIASATIVTLDNNLGAPNDGLHNFNNLQAAYNGTSAGDTIYIQGSPTSYGDLNINTHPSVFIGPGFNPENGKLPATLGIISLSPGPSNGVVFMGFIVNTFFLTSDGGTQGIYTNLSAIRCKITGDIHTFGCCYGHNQIFVTGCVFTSTGVDINLSYNVGSSRISNSIFNGSIIVDNYNNTINNNIFLGTVNAFGGGINRCTVYNNIFFRSSPNAIINNSTFNNNIIFQCSGSNAIPTGSNGNTGSNNYPGINPGFGGGFPAAGDFYSTVYDFHPTAAEALNGGVSGSTIGVFDLNNNFIEYGEPGFPRISSFIINGNTNVPQTGTLNIMIEGNRVK